MIWRVFIFKRLLYIQLYSPFLVEKKQEIHMHTHFWGFVYMLPYLRVETFAQRWGSMSSERWKLTRSSAIAVRPRDALSVFENIVNCWTAVRKITFDSGWKQATWSNGEHGVMTYEVEWFESTRNKMLQLLLLLLVAVVFVTVMRLMLARCQATSSPSIIR